jgi:hypothetical protein
LYDRAYAGVFGLIVRTDRHDLSSLGDKYRSVFVLRDIQHLSIEETARILKLSSGSVKTRLLRARLMLREFLSPGLNGKWSTTLAFAKGNKPWE